MTLVTDKSCGCGPISHPPKPDIPAGLTRLPERQLSGFPEYRAAMLTSIRGYPALAGWRARSEGDLGVMLLEAWSVVLDTVGFYDARVAERSYLSTAPDAATARGLTALIGHKPRPAMAAKVKLAVEADIGDPVNLPIGTGFRSGGFAGEPPQVFELTEPAMIYPERNRFTLAPVREPRFDGTLRFLDGQAPPAGSVLAVWSEGAAVALRVGAVEAEAAPDGVTYSKIVPSAESNPGLVSLNETNRADLKVAILRIPAAEFDGSASILGDLPVALRVLKGAAVTPFIQPDLKAEAALYTKGAVKLDSVYPQIRAGQRAVVELGHNLIPVTITKARRIAAAVPGSDPVVNQIVTEASFEPELIWDGDDDFVLHVSPFRVGSPSRIAKTTLSLSDLQKHGDLLPPVVLHTAPPGGDVIARGASALGVELSGNIVETGDGKAEFSANAGSKTFEPLIAPVDLFGNVVEVVRGETVADEVLGSGNAAEPHQSFTLRRAPLTWVEDASLPEGRRPELLVRVDGLEWKRVATFFGKAPDARVYTVELDINGDTRVTFGNGVRGARLTTGIDNIRATYRFGAGAATPPAGSITSIARPVDGLISVRGPLPAEGGANAEAPDELRETAPKSALTLGRAVSLADFEAMARGYTGILSATSAWTWDMRRQRASAQLWVIATSGDPTADLAEYLRARAAPDLMIAVQLAEPAPHQTLSITLGYAPEYDPEIVRLAVRDALYNNDTGLLAKRNIGIGFALFRSALTRRLHDVPGVAAVRAILLDGIPMKRAVAPGAGKYLDLEHGTMVR